MQEKSVSQRKQINLNKDRLRQALAEMDYTVEFNSKTPGLETKNGIIPWNKLKPEIPLFKQEK